MTDVEGPGGVGRDELEIDGLPDEGVGVTVAVTLLDDLLSQHTRGRGLESEVDETRSGDVDRGNSRYRTKFVGESGREVPRIRAHPFREFHREVRRPVAVIAIARTFEGDIGCRQHDARGRFASLEHHGGGVEQSGGEFIRGHGVRSYRQAGAPPRERDARCGTMALYSASRLPSRLPGGGRHVKFGWVMIAGVAAVLPMLAGCAPTASPSSAAPAVSPSTAPTPTATAEPAPSSSPPAVPSHPPMGARPVKTGCLDLISLDTMYGFDPNFAYDESFTPPSGSLAATAVADEGRACGWVRETGGSTIVVTAAKPAPADFAALETAAESGTPQGAAYFAQVSGKGVVQIFEGDVWITATSSVFSSAADAAPLTDSVLAALR